MEKVCDISHYNLVSDWNAFASSVSAILVKCSQANWEDDTFRDKYQHLIELKKPFGVWHFYQPDMRSGPQIDEFLGIYRSLTVKPKIIGLDCEENSYIDRQTGKTVMVEPPDRTSYSVGLMQWLQAVERETSTSIVIYSRQSFWDFWVLPSGTQVSYGGVAYTLPDWSHYGLWVASYGVSQPVLPRDWKTYLFWQWGDAALPGMQTGNVDQDWFNGTPDQLNALFGAAGQAMPPASVDYSNLKLVWPCDPVYGINQLFGANPQYYGTFGLPGHEGLDFPVPSGGLAYAAADGVVETVDTTGPYGIHVVLKHQQGGITFHSTYAHLQQPLVSVGDAVKTGQKIALTDSTGNSTGPHLHFTLKVAGAQTAGYPAGIIDPKPFLVQPGGVATTGGPTVPAAGRSALHVVTDGLRLRISPSVNGAIIATGVQNGIDLPLVDPLKEVDADGFTWDAIEAWVARKSDTQTYGEIHPAG